MQWFAASFVRSNLRCLRSYSSGHSSAVVLRPYQQACLDVCLDALRSGSTRIGVSLPTGSGKTRVFISLLSRIPPPAQSPDATRALIVVSSIELALQAATQAKELFPSWNVEVEQGVKHKASGEADVTVATYQTLLQSQRLAKFDPASLKAVIVDEAHHAAAPSYRRILSYFDPDIKSPEETSDPPQLPHRIAILGFSATFSRHDGLALGSVFERIVYHRDFLEMIKEQWLCNVRFTSVKANIDLSEITVSSRTGDFNPTSLAHVINTDVVNKLVVQTWLDRAAERRSTLVFCVNLSHVRALTAAFRTAGIDARYVYSGTPAVERKELIAAFKAVEFPVLVNCAILTEGADIPNIDCVMVAKPTRSRNVFAQMIGRGMRLSPETGKADCRIIDFVDSTNRVPGIVSTPTLFGLDPSELIDDESIESLELRTEAMQKLNEQAQASSEYDTSSSIPNPKSVTYVDYDDPFALVDQGHGAPHVRSLSTYAWVGCGDDVYVLECLGKGHIRIEKAQATEDTGEHFEAHFTPATLPMGTAFHLKISPFQKSRKILTAETLVDALRGADVYAQQKVVKGSMSLGLLRTARWRKEPATDNQKNLIRKRWKSRQDVLPDGTETKGIYKDKIANMTKGEAANIITRLKHGAQARYEKKVKSSQKVILATAKETKRAAREQVKVGPLPQAL